MTLESWQQRDCDDLAALHGAEDPRSVVEMIAEDPVTEYQVEKAVKRKDGEWEVVFDRGVCGWFKMPEGRKIKAGDRLGLYTDGRPAFGSMRHGFALNGDVIEWKTPWERYADRIAMLARFDRERRERVEKEREQISKWLMELRGPYRERIARFRQRKTFDLDGGTYETYPVLMAQRIEEWVREHHPDAITADWEAAVALVKELEAKPYEAQAAVLHAGRKDEYGVSGHQVNSAFGLAAAVLCGEAI